MTGGEIAIAAGYARVIRAQSARGEYVSWDDLTWLVRHERRERQFWTLEVPS